MLCLRFRVCPGRYMSGFVPWLPMSESAKVSLWDYANSTVLLPGGGVLIYPAEVGFAGTDSFTYRISDGVQGRASHGCDDSWATPGQFRWINVAGGRLERCLQLERQPDFFSGWRVFKHH